MAPEQGRWSVLLTVRRHRLKGRLESRCSMDVCQANKRNSTNAENRWRPVLAGEARRGFSETRNPAHCSEPLSKCPPHRLAEEADLGRLLPSLESGAKAPALGMARCVESVGLAMALVLTSGVIGSRGSLPVK